MSRRAKFTALIPAAGHSKRMGRPKLSLLLSGQPVIQHVIRSLQTAGINDILVVVGPHTADLRALIESAGAQALLLPQATPDMRATIEAGLKQIEVIWKPTDDDAFVLVPADHPALEPEAVTTLMNAWHSAGDTERSILIPTYRDQRGHPTLIGWRNVAGIRALPENAGVNAYLRGHPEKVREVAVASESILFDMDTPEDLERMQRRLSAPDSNPGGGDGL